MELFLAFPSGDSLPASEVFLSRSLGRPLRWRFVVTLEPASWGEAERKLESRIRGLLVGGPCKVRASFRDGNSTVLLGTEATVVAAVKTKHGRRTAGDNRGNAVQYLEIEADGTSVGKTPDPFIARRRVHKVRDLKQLVRRFEHVARPVGALLAELEQIVLPDGEHASIVQDGVSDWQFLHHIFDQCRWLADKRARWLPLTLVGGADESGGTQGRWIITPGVKSAYEDWGTVRDRTVRYDSAVERDGEGQVEFDSVTNYERPVEFAGGSLPCVIDRRPQRRFDESRWKRWRTMDLPRFSEDGAMIWRIEDRLYVSQEGLGWDSNAYAVPPEARFSGPERPGQLRPWVGVGKVEETSRDGPWVKVRLPGFESGDDVVDVRISTPYSGKNGRRGVHMVPEKGTEVLLAWGGRFDQSIILSANARSEAAEYASPSTYLEAEHTAQYADIHVVKVGNTTVDSRLALKVKQRTDVNSTQQLQVKADGADLKLSGGIVYTGRGM